MSYSLSQILDDLVNNISVKYLSADTTKNRTSVFGYLTESQARSIHESVVLSSKRSADSVIELSENTLKVRAAAKVRGIEIDNATPSSAIFIVLFRLSDLVQLPKTNNAHTLTIDRKSFFYIKETPFSLNDDLLLTLTMVDSTNFNYSVRFIGGNEDNVFLQTMKVTLDDGSPGVGVFVQAFQYEYLVSTKTVTDVVEFTYTGIPFEYNKQVADFTVEYRRTSTAEFTAADLIYHRSDETSTTALYYDDDRDGVIYILNNPVLNLGESSEIRITIKETTGAAGDFPVGNHQAVFTFYNDSMYDTTVLNTQAAMIYDSVGGKNAPTIAEIRQMMIRNRFGYVGIDSDDITTYLGKFTNDTVSFQKRNDVQARVVNNYTILRGADGLACPTKTANLELRTSDFDVVHGTTNRKVIKANNIYSLTSESVVGKTLKSIDIPTYEADVTKLALNTPMMMIIDGDNILSYYFNSIDKDIRLKYSYSTEYKYQFFSQSVNVYRSALLDIGDDIYKFHVEAIPNTPDNIGVKDDDGNIVSTTKLLAYVRLFDAGGSVIAYFPMEVKSYDIEKTKYVFEGSFKTNDYITDNNTLQITDGLFAVGTTDPFTDVIPYSNLNFDILFVYQDAPTDVTNSAYTDIPGLAGYTIANTYKNVDTLEIIKNLSGYMQSYVALTEEDDGGGGTETVYHIREVPFIKYSYTKENIELIYERFGELHDIYVPVKDTLIDHMVNLKFVTTYGKSSNILVQTQPLGNLMPQLNFRAYGKNLIAADIKKAIIEYFHSFAATSATIYVSNIITKLEREMTNLRSLDFLGVDGLSSEYQCFINEIPDPKTMTREELVAFVPEYFNPQTISLEIKEV